MLAKDAGRTRAPASSTPPVIQPVVIRVRRWAEPMGERSPHPAGQRVGPRHCRGRCVAVGKTHTNGVARPRSELLNRRPRHAVALHRGTRVTTTSGVVQLLAELHDRRPRHAAALHRGTCVTESSDHKTKKPGGSLRVFLVARAGFPRCIRGWRCPSRCGLRSQSIGESGRSCGSGRRWRLPCPVEVPSTSPSTGMMLLSPRKCVLGSTRVWAQPRPHQLPQHLVVPLEAVKMPSGGLVQGPELHPVAKPDIDPGADLARELLEHVFRQSKRNSAVASSSRSTRR